MLEGVKTGWSEHLELTAEIVSFASSPEDLRAKNRGEVFVTRLGVALESHTSVITIAVPLAALESFLQNSNAGGVSGRTNTRISNRNHRSAIESDLKNARMSLSARLAPLSLSARSIADLTVGQVIQTKQHVEMPIEIHVNEHPRYLGTLGQVRKHVGVQLTETVSGGKTDTPMRTTRGRVL
jgi:flagellar motor switch protein FliM